MRRLLVAALVAGAAAFVAPAPASAVCWDDTLYELTGHCGPCSVLGGPYGAVNRVAGQVTGEEPLVQLTCAA